MTGSPPRADSPAADDLSDVRPAWTEVPKHTTWHLSQSLNTRTLTNVTDPIPPQELRFGDAFLKHGEHAALFVRWADDQGSPVVWDEWDTGHPAEERA